MSISKKKFLLAGLGNPDEKYKNTRHNIGYNFLNHLKKQWHLSAWQKDKKYPVEFVNLENKNKKIILAKPLVFMNNSGKVIKYLKQFYKFPMKNIFIIHDDSDISLGKFKISYNRGSAGHKGVESIICHLKSKSFYRIRIGIRPLSLKRKKAEEFVLKNFSPEESKIIEQLFPKIRENLEKFLFCFPKENKNKN